MNKCKICCSTVNKIFNAKILFKYDVDYFECSNCKFIQTEDVYWLTEAYNNPMNFTDTGIMLRNTRSAKIVTSILLLFFNKNYTFLDYAGGYGVFTRLMRDKGFDFYWTDPYTQNLLSRGFEQKQDSKYDVLTTFESFEHFNEPLDEIEKIFKISKNLIFSTELVPVKIPNPNDWWYYGLEHGQHIALYSKETMVFIGEKFKVNYYNMGNMHLFSENKLNFFSSLFLRFKYSKQILYLLSFLLQWLLTGKTMSDMEKLKKAN